MLPRLRDNSAILGKRKALTARREPGRDQAPMVIADIIMKTMQNKRKKWVGEVINAVPVHSFGILANTMFFNWVMKSDWGVRRGDLRHF